MFEHQQTFGWNDFENLTPLEKTVSEVEQIIQKLIKSANSEKQNEISCSFMYNGNKYKIIYLMPNAKKYEYDFSFIFNQSQMDKLQLMYGIQSPLFLICPLNYSASKNEVKSLMRKISSISCVPIFVKTDPYENIGVFQYHKTKIDFSAKTLPVTIIDPNPFPSLEDIVKEVKEIHHGPSDLSFSARMIYHVDFSEKFPLLLSAEWPELDFKSPYIHYDLAPIYIIAFDMKNSRIYNFENAYSFYENHGPEFQIEPNISLSQIEKNKIDFLKKERTPTNMNDGINFAPSNCILKNLAKIMLTTPYFDLAWHNFLEYIQNCVDNNKEIQYVDYATVNPDYCLIYQKLQLINICLSKMNNDIKTSNYVITSDQLKDFENYIEKEMSTDFDLVKARKMINMVLSFKSSHDKDVKFEEFKKLRQQKISSNLKLAEVTWKIIPNSFFDMQSQREMALDYLNGLSPNEVIPSLIILLFCEEFNCLQSKRKYDYNSSQGLICEIRNSLISLINEKDVLSPNGFIQRCFNIDTMLSNLLRCFHKKMFESKELQLLDGFAKFPRLMDSLQLNGYVVVEDPHEKYEVITFFDNLVNQNYEMYQEIHVTSKCHYENPDGSQVTHRIFINNQTSKVTIATSTTEIFP